jgi:glycosyltransferase involved in cell wall biosynthesis
MKALADPGVAQFDPAAARWLCKSVGAVRVAHSLSCMAGWWWRIDYRDGRAARAAAQVICVSHTGRENTELRACLPPVRAAVIPNAVHAAHFAPADLRALLRHAGTRDGQPAPPAGCGANRPGAALPRGGAMTPGQPVCEGPEAYNEQAMPRLRPEQERGTHACRDTHAACSGRALAGAHTSPVHAPAAACQPGLHGPAPAPHTWPGRARSPQETTVVCLSRLVHRKGIDLLALVVPEACRRYPELRFVIGAHLPAFSSELA